MKFKEKKIEIDEELFTANFINYCDLPDWYIVFDLKEMKSFMQEMKEKGKVENEKYKKAYNILMDYFDSISDEEKPKVDKQLKKLNL